MAEEQNVLPKDTGTVRGKPKDAAAQTKIQPDEREMTSVPRSIAVHPATIGKHDVLSPIFHVGNPFKSVEACDSDEKTLVGAVDLAQAIPVLASSLIVSG